MKKEIKTKKAPAAIGSYSQAVETDQFVFISGQIPLNPETGEIVGGDIKTQMKCALDNLGGILSEAGLNYDNVVKTTVYLDNIEDFSEANEVYSKYFINPVKPARAAVEVGKLPKGVLVEIEAIAIK